MFEWLFADDTLPLIFAALMALAVLVYAILDGYDLGVGILLPLDDEAQRDLAIASIGPFWDANETWLVLAVGLLLVAFPAAHSAVLHALYLPATIMLFGLILRGVSFDFRAKVKPQRKIVWDRCFKIGSTLTAFTQGYMLGMYVMGFEFTLMAVIFACLSGLGVMAAYALIGSCWLIMKTAGSMQLRAIGWAKRAGTLTFLGILTVCAVNPLINEFVYVRWLTPPLAFLIALIPLLCFSMFLLGYQVLRRLPLIDDRGSWLPFVMVVIVFICCFTGLALSFYPYLVPGELTIYNSASAPESLRIMLIGTLFVMPFIIGYTVFAYTVFRGKATKLTYY
ncbi:cytochrome d ubiquinol oxidase subunit II [Alteromonas flava]|uniref:cytochrome d ubiquinol oxidase subunit II n=1 Tax=Alteromonas flava TaxID=2048003 RepID=UPI000C2923A7|nr:cytochrome d ubiquinol oxidase subunit II [Alteromonas flava]